MTTNESLFDGEGINLPSLSGLKDAEVNVAQLELHIRCVLDNHFTTASKREIVSHSSRLNFACPYCNDSAKNPYAKRGNVYLKNMSYKCFNCGAWESVHDFLYHFKDLCDVNEEELFIYKTYYNRNVRKISTDVDIFNHKLIEKWGIKREDLKKILGLIEVQNTKAEIYLKNRYQRITDQYLFDPKQEILYILNMSPNNYVIGYQVRRLKTKKYYTYKLSTIYKELKRNLTDDEKLDIEIIDSISSVFNILILDYNQPITIFEGPFDCFLFPNSIAISGAQIKSPIEAEHLRFWFDNDETGIEKAIKELKNGNSIFLWKKYLRVVGITEYMKDLNDIIIYSKENNIHLVPFDEFFSDKKIDMIYI